MNPPESFRPPLAAESLSLAWKEKCPREKDTPLGACRAGPAKSVIRGPGSGFSTAHLATAPALLYLGHPCPRLPRRPPCRRPCGPDRPHLTTAQGPHQKQRAILRASPKSQSRCRVARRIQGDKNWRREFDGWTFQRESCTGLQALGLQAHSCLTPTKHC